MSVTTRRERREKELRRKQREGRSSGGSHGRGGGGGGINPLLIAAGIVVAIALLMFVGQQTKFFSPPAPSASPVPTPAVSPNDPALGTKEKDAGNAHGRRRQAGDLCLAPADLGLALAGAGGTRTVGDQGHPAAE